MPNKVTQKHGVNYHHGIQKRNKTRSKLTLYEDNSVRLPPKKIPSVKVTRRRK